MKPYTYKVGELRRIISEAKSEMEPVIGKDVTSSNRKNSSDFYNDTDKSVKNYNKGMKAPSAEGEDRLDWNKTMFDLSPVQEPSKEYSERVKSQIKGYSSKAEEENKGKFEKTGDFEGNERILKAFTKSRDEKFKRKKETQKSGLTARELPDEWFDQDKLCETKYKPKKLNFKRTVFLNEEQVLKRIPEEYKRDGQLIYMRDAENNLYIVECTYSKKSRLMETNIIGKRNVLNEASELKRIGELMRFKTDSDFSFKANANSSTLNESETFNEMMKLARGQK